MVALCIRIIFGLATLFLFSISLGLTVYSEDSQPQTLMMGAGAESCEGNCLLGIRPGNTTLGEAMVQLEKHPWVDEFQLSASGAGYGQIRWDWSGAQPDVIDDSHRGRITFYYDREESNGRELTDTLIETISIYTKVRMDSLHTWYGPPDTGAANFQIDGGLAYTIAYHIPGGTVSLWTGMPCPVTLMSYWNAPTRITVSIGRSSSEYIEPAQMAKIC